MAEIIGYGEDSFTYWYLSRKLIGFLNHEKIKDDSLPEDCLILYRPSMGRGRGCAGELDAIVATGKAIYLIESKWEHSKEFQKENAAKNRIPNICVAPRQIRTHEIVSAILAGQTFPMPGQMFGSFKMPGPKSILFQNLNFIYSKLKKKDRCGKNARSILLFFAARETGVNKVSDPFMVVEVVPDLEKREPRTNDKDQLRFIKMSASA